MKTSREALLDIAFRLFLEHSYEKVTMNDLVAASGLSKGAFHHYFPRKPDLYQACLQHFFLRFFPDQAELAGSDASARDLVLKLADLQEKLLAELDRLGLTVLSYWRFLLNLPQEWQDQLSQGMLSAVEGLQNAFIRDAGLGLLKEGQDPLVLARSASSLLEGHGILSATGLPGLSVKSLLVPWLEQVYAPSSI